MVARADYFDAIAKSAIDQMRKPRSLKHVYRVSSPESRNRMPAREESEVQTSGFELYEQVRRSIPSHINLEGDSPVLASYAIKADNLYTYRNLHQQHLIPVDFGAALASLHPSQPPVIPAVFQALMDQLDGVRSEADDEGYPVPSRNLVESVRSLLDRVFREVPRRYSVYPMEKGEIAIDTGSDRGSVVLLCHERETWCIANIDNSPSRAWFRDRERLPEDFIRGVLASLESTSLR